MLRVAACVAGQDATAEYRGVGADEEIREYVALRATVPAVFDEGAAGEEQRGAGDFLDRNLHVGEDAIQRLERFERRRQFRVHDGG